LLLHGNVPFRSWGDVVLTRGGHRSVLVRIQSKNPSPIGCSGGK
jgi:hypothetical protein